MIPDVDPSPKGPASNGTGNQRFPHGAPSGQTPISGSPSLASPGAGACETPDDQHACIEAMDWDILFDAVETRLRQTVGERLGTLPETPAHSAHLAASLVQATVLDCVDALHKLHAAIKHDRSQRPTA